MKPLVIVSTGATGEKGDYTASANWHRNNFYMDPIGAAFRVGNGQGKAVTRCI